jgi:hypothetical protein
VVVACRADDRSRLVAAFRKLAALHITAPQSAKLRAQLRNHLAGTPFRCDQLVAVVADR